MLDAPVAAERTRKFWDCFVTGDIDGCAALVAEDVVRLGPREADESDNIRGKAAYVAFLRDIRATMPAHGGHTNEVVVTPDGRRAYIHCTEIVAKDAGSTDTIAVSVMMICHFNAAGLISLIDIFWKQPRSDIGWTRATELVDAARA